MAKPSTLTRLVKGKAIGAFPDFVATWNYIVDFIENLRGDGDDDKAKGVLLDRSVEDHPVIRLSDDYQPGGGTSIRHERLVLESGDNSNLKFTSYTTKDEDGTLVRHVKIDVLWKN